ncbi:MAG: ABC transporter ATP-binding protein [Candidatus Omnitrophica bacterium]|nr:ABC transporter ATP-binding protein [Candidatus Omnitrophota bacterium]MBU4149781.1 ABC transporter ATP-binding protein [Candidatus Omnitrophota bacterium]
MHYAVEISNLSKEFIQKENPASLLASKRNKKNIVALDDINLQIKKGECFGLVGVNGSGKTTLLKLLATLILPTKGTAHINGYNIVRDAIKVRAITGFVSSGQRSFYWRLTGRQNLEFFAALYELFQLEARRRIDELAALLEIEKYMDYTFYSCSAGIQQRFFLAQSLLHNPDVLLLDEPTKGLDTVIAKQLRSFIKEKFAREQGKTVLFTTHDHDEMAMFSDRIAILEHGQIKTVGTADGLRDVKLL